LSGWIEIRLLPLSSVRVNLEWRHRGWGRVSVAAREPNDGKGLRAIHDRGLNLWIMFDNAGVMLCAAAETDEMHHRRFHDGRDRFD
jgi:hypothetical protein